MIRDMADMALELLAILFEIGAALADIVWAIARELGGFAVLLVFWIALAATWAAGGGA